MPNFLVEAVELRANLITVLKYCQEEISVFSYIQKNPDISAWSPIKYFHFKDQKLCI